MATGTVRPSTVPPPPPVPAGHVEHERVIKRQLGRTTWHVRLVDLFSGLAAWAIAVIAFLFLAALVDHWIGLGTFGRLAALTILAERQLVLPAAPHRSAARAVDQSDLCRAARSKKRRRR